MDSRLSSLPDDIIHKILSTVSMQDVIRTSVLSSRWRYIWTSMPFLSFLSEEFFTWWVNWRMKTYKEDLGDKFAQFVKHVMSHRNNQVPVSCLKLDFHREISPSYIEKIMNYILSYNVQQMDVQCVWGNDWYSWINDSVTITLLSSQSLKRLSLTTEHNGYGEINNYLTFSSTLELTALTTLYLSRVVLYPDNNTLFSKCPNLKNLTLKGCKMKGSDSLSICHQRLSNLTLKHERGSARVVNVVAPQLENLTIRYYFEDYDQDKLFYRENLRKYKHMISAPNLMSLLYEGYHPLPLSTDGFHSLEYVDLWICDITDQEAAAEALEIVRLFQHIQSVKFLTLNLEILELLSSYVQVISHHPPPFANLRSLDIYPLHVRDQSAEEILDISTEVIDYLLDGSQGVHFTMVSRLEAVADMNTTKASVWMADLQTYLDTEKDIIESNRDHKQKQTESDDVNMYNNDDYEEPETQMAPQILKSTKRIKRCWYDHTHLVRRCNRIVDKITSYLEAIESVLTKLPASNRAMLQPCFCDLWAEANIFVSAMTERINIRGGEYLNNASHRFQEIATSLQSFQN